MIEISKDLADSIHEHAREEYPDECCGLVDTEGNYHKCTNLQGGKRFFLKPEDWQYVEDNFGVSAVVHSHINESPFPSGLDRVECFESGVPWIIVSWPKGSIFQFDPEPYDPPLIGREYVWGIFDCFTLVRDYYKTLGVVINDRPREEDFYSKDFDVIGNNFELEGFVKVDGPLKLHDVVVMQIRSNVPSHLAIYKGDDKILHHVVNRGSGEELYGGLYKKSTRYVLRHKNYL